MFLYANELFGSKLSLFDVGPIRIARSLTECYSARITTNCKLDNLVDLNLMK